MATKHITDEFIQKTIKLWQPYYPNTLTKEDARKIIANMTSFTKLVVKAGIDG